MVGGTARTAAEPVGVNRHTATRQFRKLHEIIAGQMAAEACFLDDERYFGAVRKGKRGRGIAGKVPVFGLLKRGGGATSWRRS